MLWMIAPRWQQICNEDEDDLDDDDDDDDDNDDEEDEEDSMEAPKPKKTKGQKETAIDRASEFPGERAEQQNARGNGSHLENASDQLEVSAEAPAAPGEV